MVKTKELAKVIANFKVEINNEGIVELPQYCRILHMSFRGKDFPPELTLSPYGFMIRRKSLIDLKELSYELRCIFGKE